MNDSANGWIRQPADFRSAATTVSETCAELGLGLLVIRVSPSNREVAQVVVVESDGEPGGNRTHNPQIKSLLLCQLSYRPGGNRGADRRRKPGRAEHRILTHRSGCAARRRGLPSSDVRDRCARSSDG